MAKISLKCSCGAVRGSASHITAKSGTRIVCYCKDCQAFARYLERENTILDEYGGTDIFQLTPSQITLTEGTEQIRCMRLSPKGLYRWYTACCKTPIGNTLSAGVPFVGVVLNFMDDGGVRDDKLGPVRGHVYTKCAKGPFPAVRKQKGFTLWLIIRSLFKLLIWKLAGKNKPSPFFDVNGNPISEPYIPI